MPNVRISAAADAGTLLSSDMLPLARSGDTNAYHATMAEISAFASTSVSSGAYNNTGRNLIHNPMFNIAQRGNGPWTTYGYNLDRWYAYTSLDTISISRGLLADVDRAAIGDEAAQYNWINVFAGNAGAGAYNQLMQPIEGVRRLSGKTVTVSLWARYSAGTPKISIGLAQVFGTGGSPSAEVAVAAIPITVSGTWARYSVTLVFPSTAGKTVGTNGDDSSNVVIWFSSGTTFNANAGGIGVQSGTVAIWGVQCEVGSVATPLAKRDPADELALCQRFYQTGNIQHYGYNSAGGNYAMSNSLPVFMRSNSPTMTFAVVLNTNCSVSVGNLGAQQINMYGTATATGSFLAQASYTASADL